MGSTPTSSLNSRGTSPTSVSVLWGLLETDLRMILHFLGRGISTSPEQRKDAKRKPTAEASDTVPKLQGPLCSYGTALRLANNGQLVRRE